MGVPGSIPHKVLGNFQVTYFVCQLSVDLGRIQLLTEMITKEFPWGRRVDLTNLPCYLCGMSKYGWKPNILSPPPEAVALLVEALLVRFPIGLLRSFIDLSLPASSASSRND